MAADLKKVIAPNNANAAEVLKEVGDLPDRVKSLGFAFNELELVLPDDLIADAKVIKNLAVKLSLPSVPQDMVKPESKVFNDACARVGSTSRRQFSLAPTCGFQRRVSA